MKHVNVCKKCGERLQYGGYGTDGKPHRCTAKVKVYTDEEKKKLAEEKKKESK
jgi:hypothetical protein